MKKKLLCLLLLFTLVFTVGCNKKEAQSDPTPTPTPTSTPAATATPTPTPVPENLAKTNLEKLPAAYATLLSYSPDYTTDYSKGIGYDMSMDVTVDSSIMELLGLSEIKNLSLDGSLDYKDIYAGTFTLFLNEDEVLNFSVQTDFNNILFNLPKYSSQYASVTMAELLGSEEEIALVDMSQMPTNAELYDMLLAYLNRFVDCFKPQTDIVSNATIGTGDYVVTGDKYTIIASDQDILTLLEEMEVEFASLMGAFAAEEDAATEEVEGEPENIILNYYAGADNSYAWEILTDSPDSEPVVFVSTAAGFCLYGLSDGTPEIILYSIATTETEGTLYIPANAEEETAEGTEQATTETTEEPEPLGVIDYELDDNYFYAEGYFDTMEISMECTISEDTTHFEYEIVMEGVSLAMEETITKDHVEATITLASYGMKLGTVTVTSDVRDYAEITVPQETTDMETWTAEMDQTALTTDLTSLMEKYPNLAALLFPSEEDPEEDPANDPAYDDPSVDTREPGTIPEGYTDDFMGMTGYFVDSDGYVDFTPLEAEVLAAGKPSTGHDRIALSDDQKQALLDYASGVFEEYYYSEDNYYSVWGSIEYGGVKSSYTTEYYYGNTSNYSDFIFLDFDAVSGEFISMNIYTETSEKSLQVANDVLKILGVDYTLTAEDAAEYVLVNNLLLSGYDGETYFNVDINAYFE